MSNKAEEQAAAVKIERVVLELIDASACLPHCGGQRLQRAISAAKRLLTQPRPAVPASGAAGTEVSAWGVMVQRDPEVLCVPFTVREAAQHFVALNAQNEKMTVVPLYAAPQAASGWLTEEERDFLGQVRDYHATAAMGTGSAAHESHSRRVYGLLGDLLARSTPPEVVLPLVAGWGMDGHAMLRRAEVQEALAAAGVPWKEVGK